MCCIRVHVFCEAKAQSSFDYWPTGCASIEGDLCGAALYEVTATKLFDFRPQRLVATEEASFRGGNGPDFYGDALMAKARVSLE